MLRSRLRPSCGVQPWVMWIDERSRCAESQDPFQTWRNDRIGSMDTIRAKNNKVGFYRNTIANLARKECVSDRKRQRHDPKQRERAPQLFPRPHSGRAKEREKEYRAGTQDTDSVD